MKSTSLLQNSAKTAGGDGVDFCGAETLTYAGIAGNSGRG